MSLYRQIARDESGFSLVELLTAMVVGSVVLLALMFLMTTGFRKTAEVNDRAEAAQSGRSGMDRILTLLDSGVCLGPLGASSSVPPLIGSKSGVQGSDGSYIAFYADLNGASDTPDRYTITYDATARTLTEVRSDGVGALPNTTWPGATQTRVIATDVLPADDPNTGAALPIFRYFAYEPDGTIDVAAPLATPITDVLASQVVRVNVAFEVISRRTRVEDARSTSIEGQSIVGTPDPSNPSGGSCP